MSSPSALLICVTDCNGRAVEMKRHCWVCVAGVLYAMQSNGICRHGCEGEQDAVIRGLIPLMYVTSSVSTSRVPSSEMGVLLELVLLSGQAYCTSCSAPSNTRMKQCESAWSWIELGKRAFHTTVDTKTRLTRHGLLPSIK